MIFHRVASLIEHRYGDKSEEKSLYLRGIQGRVARPCQDRDYVYFLAKVSSLKTQCCGRGV